MFVSLGAFVRLFVLPVWEWSLLLHRAFELTSPDAWRNRLVCPTRTWLLTHRVFSRRNPSWHFFFPHCKGNFVPLPVWPVKPSTLARAPRLPDSAGPFWHIHAVMLGCTLAGWQPSAIHESVLWAAHWECAPPPSSSYTSLPIYITLYLPFLSSVPLCPPPAANPSTHLIPFLPSPALLSPDRPPCLGS